MFIFLRNCVNVTIMAPNYGFQVPIPSMRSYSYGIQLRTYIWKSRFLVTFQKLCLYLPKDLKRFNIMEIQLGWFSDTQTNRFSRRLSPFLCVTWFVVDENRFKSDHDKSSYANWKRSTGRIWNCVLFQWWFHFKKINKKSVTKRRIKNQGTDLKVDRRALDLCFNLWNFRQFPICHYHKMTL